MAAATVTTFQVSFVCDPFVENSRISRSGSDSTSKVSPGENEDECILMAGGSHELPVGQRDYGPWPAGTPSHGKFGTMTRDPCRNHVKEWSAALEANLPAHEPEIENADHDQHSHVEPPRAGRVLPV